jgi:hypothetical protein
MTAPIIATFNPRIGRKNSILIGYAIITAATIGFGLLSEIPNT